MSVQSQISSALNEGLVAKAIIQSGGGLRGLASGQKTLEAAEATGKAMWDAYGCTTLEEMRAVPASKFDEVLAAYYATLGPGMGYMGLPYSPIIDGELLSNAPISIALEGAELQIPYMIGWVAQDLMPQVMESAAIDWCLLQEQQGRPSYAYCFSRDLPGDEEANEPESFGNMPGAFHSAELWYVFGTLDNCWRPMTEADYELSERMVTYWTNFAKYGNPNGETVPEWTPCTAAQPHVQNLDIL